MYENISGLMNVVFLDYDGVVNTPMWDASGEHCRFNLPEDNAVNNFQCVQWVSEFCEKYNYSIVVTSTWRLDGNYADCLRNGGLRERVEVLGATPFLRDGTRGDEIRAYLDGHPETDRFLIFDDDDDMGELSDYLVMCDTNIGFCINKYYEAVRLHEKLKRHVELPWGWERRL